MLDSLARLSRLERQIDRLLPEQTDEASPWSTAVVLTEYADDPVGFARDLAGYELEIELPDGTVCDYQARIARAVLEHSKVAVRSGHKLGKSLLAVLLAVWWVTTREEGRAVLTASTDRQVKRVLWRELRKLYRRLKKRGFDILPEPALDPGTGCQWDDGREIIGFATKVPENAAGFSGPSQLFVLDEGSGIPTEIYEAFAGNMAGGAKMLACSNPTQPSGWFYEAFHERRQFWRLVHLSCEDSPNYLAGKTIIPGLAERAYVDEVVATYGKDSPFHDVRVAGRFPRQSANAVVGLGLVEAARERWRETLPGDVLDIGVDVARFGDDESVVGARRGLLAYGCLAVHGYDTIQVAGLVRRVIRLLRDGPERVRIKVDVIGYGAGVFDQLVYLRDEGKLGDHVELIAVNVAEKSNDPDEYALLRDELWFGVRHWLADGGAFEGDGKLESELVAPTYGFTRKGAIKVESKDEIRKRLKRSPDRADALALAIYEGRAVPIEEQPPLPDQSRWAGVEGRGF